MSIGPKVTTLRTCFECDYCRSKRYVCQGDSGCDVKCAHPNAPQDNYIGDTKWDTPSWCPAESESKG